MTPLTYYQKKISSGEIWEDPQQLAVMQRFEVLYHTIMRQKKIWHKFTQKKQPQGIYLWGQVGTGKTFLVDTFYHSLPFQQKTRLHFYSFMRQLHADLHQLKGVSHPLQKIAQTWRQKTRVLCFDEFFVHDIGDALLLGGLLKAFMKEGIYWVINSNFAPDALYLNGLQRELFLPAIEEIKARLEVIHLTSAQDYRQNNTNVACYYLYPLTDQTEKILEKNFIHFSNGAESYPTALPINDRMIQTKKWAEGVVWFDFKAICGVPRNHDDYLELVQRFHTIMVSGIPIISDNDSNLVRSLMRFIDVLYDAKIRLIISAESSIDQIYTGKWLAFEFARTRSRLKQMQHSEWGKKVVGR